MGIKRKTKAGSSFIARQTGKISSKLCDMTYSSLIMQWVRSIGTKNDDEDSLTAAKLCKKAKLQNKISTPVKHFFASSVENSVICSFYRRFVSSLLLAPTYIAAVFFLAFGLYCSISLAVKMLFIHPAGAQLRDFFVPVSCVLLSIILVFCRESIVSKLAGSRFFSFFIYNILMLDAVKDYEKNGGKAAAGKNRISLFVPVLLGVLAGVATVFASPGSVLIALALTAGTAVVVYSPETGLSISLLLFPFFGEKFMTFWAAVTLVSYFLKLLRGKRNISFRYTDIIIILIGIYYAVTLKSGYAFSAAAIYLVAVNTVKTKYILSSCISALSFGFIICTVFGAAEFVIETIASYIETDRFVIHTISSVFDSESEFVIYAICVLPFFLFRAKLSNASRIPGALFLLLLCGVCVIDGISASLPILVVSFIIYFVISTGRLFEGVVGISFFAFLMIRFMPVGRALVNTFEKNTGILTRSLDSVGDLILGRRGAEFDPETSGLAALILNGGAIMLIIAATAVFMICCNVFGRLWETRSKTVYGLCLAPLFTIIAFSFGFNVFDSGIMTVIAYAAAMARIGNTVRETKTDAMMNVLY